MHLTVIILIALISCVIAIETESEESSRHGHANKLSVSSTNFTFNILKDMDWQDSSSVCFSPFSIMTTFASLTAGAQKQTEKELIQALFGDEEWAKSTENVNQEFEKLFDDETFMKSKGCKVKIANRVYIQKSFNVKPKFKDILEKQYKCSVVLVDFTDKSNGRVLLREINDWVAAATDNQIKQLYEKTFSVDTEMILLNAIHFDGKWMNEFSKDSTKPGKFHSFGKDEKDVMFMDNEIERKYYRSSAFTIVQLKYVKNFAFYIVLPRKCGELKKVVSNLDHQKLKKATKQMYSKKVHLKFPRFKLENNYDLKPILTKMGVHSAFSSAANFDGITETDIKISEAFHKASVAVNERGTKATAATGVSFTARMIEDKVTVNVNCPFLFYIQHLTSEVILFAGIVNDIVRES